MTTASLPAIPSSWIWAELGDVLTAIEAGKSFKCAERPPTDGEVGVVKVSAVTWGTFDENASKTCLSSGRVAPELFISQGDFLFSRANTIQLVGACVIVHTISRRLMLSDKILRLRFRDAVPEWLLYVLRSPWGRSEIERLATGNQESMRNIGQDRIRAIRVPVPPLAEQNRIAGEVEQQLTCLDAGESATVSVSRRSRSLRRAILQHALETARGYQHSLVSVDDVATLIQYGTSEKCTTGPGIAVLRMGNITSDGRLVLDNLKYLPRSRAQGTALLLEPGDLLFNRTNSAELVGKTAVYSGNPDPCTFASYLIRVRLKPSCSPDFLALCLNSGYGRSWARGVTSQQVGQANINGSKLTAFRFPLPSTEAQCSLVATVAKRLSEVTRTEAAVAHTRARTARLRQAILQRAFEGKLVPQDPNDEPASVLLDRIRKRSPEVHA